jgi:hypothetical protein
LLAALLGAPFPTGQVHTEPLLAIPLKFGPVWLGVASAKGQLPITKTVIAAPTKIEFLKASLIGFLLLNSITGDYQHFAKPRGLSALASAQARILSSFQNCHTMLNAVP